MRKSFLRAGKGRVYAFNINFNKQTGRFIMTQQFSDYDFRGTTEIVLNAKRTELYLISPFDADDGEFFCSKIDFKNEDNLIWEVWSNPFDQNGCVSFLINLSSIILSRIFEFMEELLNRAASQQPFSTQNALAVASYGK